MAVELIGEEFAVTGTAQQLTSLLGLTSNKYFQALALRAGEGNTGTVYGGLSDVTTGAHRRFYLRAGESFTIDIHTGYCSTGQWYLVGSVPGDIVHAAGAS